MTLQGGGFAAAVIPAAKHRSKIRGRPSGLKGRRRDRCATGRRPALDPGATTAPHAQRHRAGAGPLPAEPPRRLAAPIKIKSLQTKSPRFQGIATSAQTVWGLGPRSHVIVGCRQGGPGR
jgi:hypothetical protein